MSAAPGWRQWTMRLFGVCCLSLTVAAQPASWQAIASDAVQAQVLPADAAPALALVPGATLISGGVRLRYDFAGHGGYAGLRLAQPLEFPERFELTVRLRGSGARNNLEIKFIDASGENVWWIRRPEFELPDQWQTYRFKRRHVSFAWGPTTLRELHRSSLLEVVVSAGSGGGAGELQIADLSLRELPPEASAPAPMVSASSVAPGSDAAAAVDGDLSTAWHSLPGGGDEQSLTVDWGVEREFGGVTLRWLPEQRPIDYELQVRSDASEDWRTLRRVRGAHTAEDRLYLPETQARWLRLLLHRGGAGGYGLRELGLEPLAFGASLNDYFLTIARDQPRGTYPRAYAGEQSYWTVVGNSGGHESGLLSEDGAFEVAYRGPSIEPWVELNGKSYGWAQVQSTQRLADGYLPLPEVLWQAAPFRLQIAASAYEEGGAAGTAAAEHGLVRYTYTNRTNQAQDLWLALMVRPFQVNPPTQFLNGAGGVSPIHAARWQGQQLLINQERTITPLLAPTDVVAASFDAGADPISLLAQAPAQAPAPAANATPSAPLMDDEFGFGAVALRYHLRVPAHGNQTVAVDVPWSGTASRPFDDAASLSRWLQQRQLKSLAYWRESLNRVELHGPAAVGTLSDTLRSALAQVLMSRDGAAIQPGTRSYRRSWVRDGALSSAALLALGHEADVRNYIDWYTPYIFESGKVPCCVDRRGADPVPENDSAGELLYLVSEYYRYTQDHARLERLWPQLHHVADYLESMRQSERRSVLGAATRSAESERFVGLLPVSISHEGYSAKPMHSYWDDFWGLKGFDAAAALAGWAGDAAAGPLGIRAQEFRDDLLRSIRTTASQCHINFIPGAADLCDFDATSTTVALSPQGEQRNLPPDLLAGTFERYWRQFQARRDGVDPWDVFTPYEIRNVGAMLRLGWPERARSAMDWFQQYRRPLGWNQWAEVVGKDARQPRFIGDMPHGWVAADFIRSTIDLFAFERSGGLVLAAGVDPKWLRGAGIAVERLRTPYGPLSYRLRAAVAPPGHSGGYELDLAALLRVPPAGVTLMLGGRQIRVGTGRWHIEADGRVVGAVGNRAE